MSIPIRAPRGAGIGGPPKRWTAPSRREPVSGSANSSKSDSIPDVSYLAGLCNLQARALVAARPAYKESDWVRVVEPYVADLKVPWEVLGGAELKFEELETSLTAQCARTIPSLISLAEASGFSPGWMHR